jgi:hypothetical protein
MIANSVRIHRKSTSGRAYLPRSANGNGSVGCHTDRNLLFTESGLPAGSLGIKLGFNREQRTLALLSCWAMRNNECGRKAKGLARFIEPIGEKENELFSAMRI